MDSQNLPQSNQEGFGQNQPGFTGQEVSGNRVKKGEFKKILLVIVILLILTAALFLVRYQRQKSLENLAKIPVEQTAQKPVLLKPGEEGKPGGSFLISPSSTNLKAGQKASFNLEFETSGKILDGTDALVNFDPLYLEAEGVKTEDVFEEYPVKRIDNAKGTVRITGLKTRENADFSSKLILGSITFRAKKAGNTLISFDFVKGKTNLSTLIETGTSRNILDIVQGSAVTIE
jgi:hypothetical protein